MPHNEQPQQGCKSFGLKSEALRHLITVCINQSILMANTVELVERFRFYPCSCCPAEVNQAHFVSDITKQLAHKRRQCT